MAKLKFDLSESVRVQLTVEQQKQIEQLYSQAAKEIEEAAKKLPVTVSDMYRQQYLANLQKQLVERFNQIQEELNSGIQTNMRKVCEAAVKDNTEFLSKAGLSIKGAYSHVPDEIIRTIITGKLYEGNWTLSKALWGSNSKTQQDIQTIIAKGIAENKSAYDIAKDLEKYVDPKAKKDWDWSKVYPGTSRRVDYNAQRLARTMVSHAYQQSFIRMTQKNPFVEAYQWISGHTERTCEICIARETNDSFGLGRGIYPKDALPLDHPNGLCTFIGVIPPMMDVSNRLADWAKGKSDPAIDAWMTDMFA